MWPDQGVVAISVWRGWTQRDPLKGRARGAGLALIPGGRRAPPPVSPSERHKASALRVPGARHNLLRSRSSLSIPDPLPSPGAPHPPPQGRRGLLPLLRGRRDAPATDHRARQISRSLAGAAICQCEGFSAPAEGVYPSPAMPAKAALPGVLAVPSLAARRALFADPFPASGCVPRGPATRVRRRQLHPAGIPLRCDAEAVKRSGPQGRHRRRSLRLARPRRRRAVS